MGTKQPQLICLTAALVCGLLLCACSPGRAAQKDRSEPDAWTTDVVGVSEMHLSPDYWVEQTHNPDRILADQQKIAEFNASAFSSDQHLVDLDQLPEQLSADEISSRILAVSKPYRSGLYDSNGVLLDSATYARYTENLALGNIRDSVDVRFALVVKRSDMRTYPTGDRYYSSLDSKNLDRFQENGLFPGDALAVLHQSADGEWFFVQSYNYPAWVRKQDLAFGDRQTIYEYMSAPRFLVITGDKVRTSFNPQIKEISELQLDMGVRIPLVDPRDRDNNVHGQNPYASYTVLLPVRGEEGNLELRQALIARNKDVHKGYLPYTRENITRQAFKFLGERYGWGHSFNARDCTGFVAEVYKTFGIYMPRNSGQQGSSPSGENTRFTSESSLQDKLREFKSLDTGDLIYIPGHVMMFIGNADDQPYVIHDVSGLSYIDEDGEYYKGILNGVSVTPLIPLRLSQETSYIDRLYNIKRIR